MIECGDGEGDTSPLHSSLVRIALGYCVICPCRSLWGDIVCVFRVYHAQRKHHGYDRGVYHDYRDHHDFYDLHVLYVLHVRDYAPHVHHALDVLEYGYHYHLRVRRVIENGCGLRERGYEDALRCPKSKITMITVRGELLNSTRLEHHLP